MKVQLENQFIEGLGTVNGNVEWYFGFLGSLEEPPQPPSIEEVNITVNGEPVDAETIFDNEDVYERLCAVVADCIHRIEISSKGV